MKKLLSIFLAVALLSVLLVFPANAVENGNKYLDRYIDQYHNGRYPTGFDADVFEYEELYYHYPNGSDDPDWALIKADTGCHLEVLTYDVFFGRAFANNDVAVPFTYGYGVYDAATERFLDFDEIDDISRFPGLIEALDEYHVGQAIGEPTFGDDLLFKDEFMKQANYLAMGRTFTAEQTVKSYNELYYHHSNGVVDWVLVQGESWFRYPEGSVYDVVGDRVFRNEGICEPFGNTYAVYNVRRNQFYDLRGYLVNPYYAMSEWFPGLREALDELNLGEKIGDLNRDGKVDIRDVTQMQRCLAEFCDYPENDGVEAVGCKNQSGENIEYLSDVNRDKQRDIKDATKTQMNLAEFN